MTSSICYGLLVDVFARVSVAVDGSVEPVNEASVQLDSCVDVLSHEIVVHDTFEIVERVCMRLNKTTSIS